MPIGKIMSRIVEIILVAVVENDSHYRYQYGGVNMLIGEYLNT